MTDIIQKATIGNEELRIMVDVEPISPRDWDNLGIMACWHDRYVLGDKHEFAEPKEFTDYMKEHLMLMLPLYLYDHSGLCISTKRDYPFNCQWDSMQIGFIYVTYEKMKREGISKKGTPTMEEKAKAIEMLRQEVKTYNQYLTGQVYGYVIVKHATCNMNEDHEETIDSCFGFYDIEGIYEHIDDKWKTVTLEDVTQ